MTDQMDALPETEAIRMLSMFIDTAVGTRVTMHTTRIKEVRAELIRLAEENARLRPMLTARSQEMLRLVSESGELKTRAEKAEARVQELERENGELRSSVNEFLCDTCNTCFPRSSLRAGVRCVVCPNDSCGGFVTPKESALRRRAEAELAAIKKRIAEASIQMVPCAPTPDGLVNKRMRLLDDEAKS